LAEEQPSCIFAGFGDVLPSFNVFLGEDAWDMRIAARRGYFQLVVNAWHSAADCTARGSYPKPVSEMTVPSAMTRPPSEPAPLCL